MNRHAQRGITLVVSLIMLIVLTLLVVSAIRFGNINLKIANNAQVEAEAAAAAQVAIEKQIENIVAATAISATKIADVPAQVMTVSTGGRSYSNINVSKPACILNSNVVSTELDPTIPSDRACFGGGNQDLILDKDGKPIPQPTECKNQQWDIAAGVNDATSGAQITMVQGISLRVPSQTHCPD
ncbi:hypothetical protein GCM10027034_10590 [Ramlibacter solisilvae]|uniref:Type 4 fimbrial biogenesis protein PilX N-terminal domain-containing protein n=1 Tax=Ramlibacter tataouinensis TaxID=94132 RepID=A0A127JXA0_9BURK|nr:PilX N-terminal domain-containing pilus assembly protein [Ramlibacter tataouinensis]AMO24626.1 hypothetical protein UC35_19530 [Ramlibacter tataouinensis]